MEIIEFDENKAGVLNYTYCVSNELINGEYYLSLNDTRLLRIAISKLDSRKNIAENRIVYVDAYELAHCYNISLNGAELMLERSPETLFKNFITVKERVNCPEKRKRAKTLHISWVSQVLKDMENKRIGIVFNKDIIPHLTNLQNRFSAIKIAITRNFESHFTYRLFDLMEKVAATEHKTRHFELEQFKHLLGVENKYKNYGSLFEKVIQPSLAEINAKTNFQVAFVKNRGEIRKKVTELTFIVAEKANAI